MNMNIYERIIMTILTRHPVQHPLLYTPHELSQDTAFIVSLRIERSKRRNSTFMGIGKLREFISKTRERNGDVGTVRAQIDRMPEDVRIRVK